MTKITAALISMALVDSILLRGIMLLVATRMTAQS
jgi:hypothetical protein